MLKSWKDLSRCGCKHNTRRNIPCTCHNQFHQKNNRLKNVCDGHSHFDRDLNNQCDCHFHSNFSQRNLRFRKHDFETDFHKRDMHFKNDCNFNHDLHHKDICLRNDCDCKHDFDHNLNHFDCDNRKHRHHKDLKGHKEEFECCDDRRIHHHHTEEFECCNDRRIHHHHTEEFECCDDKIHNHHHKEEFECFDDNRHDHHHKENFVCCDDRRHQPHHKDCEVHKEEIKCCDDKCDCKPKFKDGDEFVAGFRFFEAPRKELGIQLPLGEEEEIARIEDIPVHCVKSLFWINVTVGVENRNDEALALIRGVEGEKLLTHGTLIPPHEVIFRIYRKEKGDKTLIYKAKDCYATDNIIIAGSPHPIEVNATNNCDMTHLQTVDQCLDKKAKEVTYIVTAEAIDPNGIYCKEAQGGHPSHTVGSGIFVTGPITATAVRIGEGKDC